MARTCLRTLKKGRIMPWVQRNASGAISGVFANEQPGYADELLADNDPIVVAFLNPSAPQTVLSQDLMAQFTAADAAAIQAAVAGNVQFWLLWSAMQAQKDPMIVTNARFLAGWSALITVLGAPRMTAIATALGVTI
jgi:hypothetical protein